MLIRSQDKKFITEQIKIKIEKNPFNGLDGRVSDISSDRFSNTLGVYSTEEKALKVIDMIQAEYRKYLSVMGGPALVKGGMDVQPAVYNIPKVFQMPQDDEVDV